MATNGWQALGNVLGGGGQAAEESGFVRGMQGRLLTARTADALANAQIARDKQVSQERSRGIDFTDLEAVRRGFGDLVAAGYGADYAGVSQGVLRGQEYGNRRTLADALAPAAERLAAGDAVQGKFEAFRPVGSHGFYDATDLDAGVQQPTDPLGKALTGNLPSSLQELQALRDMTPEQQQNFWRIKRGDQRFEMAGVQHIRTPDGRVIPLGTLQDELDAAAGKATATARGKGSEERTQLFINDGLSAADSMPVINRAIELLDTVQTGGIHRAQLAATNLLGVTGADEAELSNNLGKAVLSQLRATFGAQFTEREGARLEQIEAGFGKSTEGNKRLLSQIKQIVERAARRGLDAADRSGDTFSADEIRAAMNMKLTPGEPRKSTPAVRQQPSQPVGAPVRLSAANADTEYEALPSGAEFIDPNGVRRRKP